MELDRQALDTALAALEQQAQAKRAELHEIEETAKRFRAARNSKPAKPKPKRAAKPKPAAERVSTERMEQVYAAAERLAVAERHEFITTGALSEALPTIPRGTINTTVQALTDAGRLRLDHKGGVRGTEKFYRLATP